MLFNKNGGMTVVAFDLNTVPKDKLNIDLRLSTASFVFELAAIIILKTTEVHDTSLSSESCYA